MCAVDDLDVVVAEQLDDAHLLGLVVLDDQQALAARLRVVLDPRQRASLEPSVVVGLVRKEKAPRARPCWRSSSSVTIWTGMCAGGRVLLELAEHGPAQHVGQEDVERDRGRLVLAGQRERVGAAHGDEHLEALVAGQVDEDARVVRDRPRRSGAPSPPG